jgi:hypothetical protein
MTFKQYLGHFPTVTVAVTTIQILDLWTVEGRSRNDKGHEKGWRDSFPSILTCFRGLKFLVPYYG